MHGRLALFLALLALPLLLPDGASATAVRDRTGDAGSRHLDIRRVEAFTTSAGALIRVTLRAPLRGSLQLSFGRRPGGTGATRRSASIRGRRRTDFLFAGDARALSRVVIRTRRGRDGDTATLRLPRLEDDCAALTRLRSRLRTLRGRSPAVGGRLRAVARRRERCLDAPAPGAAPLPLPEQHTPAVPGAPAAGYALAHGLTPEDPLEAGASVSFADASQGADLVSYTWDFGDGTGATGRNVEHAFAAPGRYVVLLTVANSAGATSRFGREVYVRGPGSETIEAEAVGCPGAGETTEVTVAVRVPSWAHGPYGVEYTIPSGPCSADASNPRDLTLTPGNAGDTLDAWGRDESTVGFTFDLSDGTGSGTVTPVVTASWG